MLLTGCNNNFPIICFLGGGITKCSNELYKKFTNLRKQNNYLLDHIGYMFRPVNRRPNDNLLTGRNM